MQRTSIAILKQNLFVQDLDYVSDNHSLSHLVVSKSEICLKNRMAENNTHSKYGMTVSVDTGEIGGNV